MASIIVANASDATHRDIIRAYADMLRTGTADGDLTPRQRRLAAVILATASNTPWADTAYPPADDTRERIARAMGSALWDGNARAFMQAIGPSADADYDVAIARAADILRNL